MEGDDGGADGDDDDDDDDDNAQVIIVMRTCSISKALYIKGVYNCSCSDRHLSDF